MKVHLRIYRKSRTKGMPNYPLPYTKCSMFLFGKEHILTTDDMKKVTCKNCLKALAKREIFNGEGE